MDLSKINFHESDKLVGHKNYLVWAFKVEQIFIREDVWDIIDPTTATLASSTTASMSTVSTSASQTMATNSQSMAPATVTATGTTPTVRFDLKRKQKCILIATVTNAIIPTVKRLKDDPALLWTRLRQKFLSAALQRKIDLRNELQNIRMKEGTSIEEHMLRIELLLSELADLDEEVEERILAQIVLSSLPPTWHPFRSTFGTIMAKDPSFTFADLEENLHAEEHRQKQFESHEEVMSAYQREQQSRELNQQPHYRQPSRGPTRGRSGPHYSNQRSRNTPPDRNDRSRLPHCSCCGKRGHTEADYKYKEMELQLKSLSLASLQEIQRKFLANRQQSNLVADSYQVHSDNDDQPYEEHVTPSEEVNLVAMLSTMEQTQNKRTQDREWIMDSGASSHFSKEKQNFSKFSPSTSSSRVTTAGGLSSQ